MKRTIVLAVALIATWLIWSGIYKPLLLGLGLLSVLITLQLANRMGLTRREFFTLDLIPSMLGYWFWLLLETARANLQVTKIILSPGLPISPTMVTLKNPCKGFIGEATLANSITLTPGTLTVDAREGEFQIHCLTREGADEVMSGDMDRRVLKALGDY